MKGKLFGGLLAAVVVGGLLAAPVGATASPQAGSAGVHKAKASKAGHDKSFGVAQRAAAISAAQASAAKTLTELGLSSDQGLTVKDVVRDPDGTTHVRYDRTYRGLPVVGGDFILHRAPSGQLRDSDWTNRADLSSLSSVRPTTSAVTAVAVAKQSVGHARTAEAPSLAVWMLGRQPQLVWKTIVAGRHGANPRAVFVDAKTGKNVASWPLNQTSDATGTGQTLYSGDVTIHTDDNRCGRHGAVPAARPHPR